MLLQSHFLNYGTLKPPLFPALLNPLSPEPAGRRRVINKETGAPSGTTSQAALQAAKRAKHNSLADVVVQTNSKIKKTLGDQQGKFSFASPSYSVIESAGIIEIDVLFHRRATRLLLLWLLLLFLFLRFLLLFWYLIKSLTAREAPEKHLGQ